MNIVLAPNAFKGSLSASDAAFAMEKGVRAVYPDAEIIRLPLADGGAGTMDALVEATLGDFIEADCTDATGDTLIAPWGMLGADLERPRTAVIELATTCGLKNIPLKKRNPLLTSTFGAGEQVRAALDEMCRDVIFGLGDTGTHDCGAGIAQALGVRLLDNNGKEIERGGAALLQLTSIDNSANALLARGGSITAAYDVENLLLGKHNTARVFAPQKGADADAVKVLEEASAHFAKIVKRELGCDVGKLVGGGAAGGVGAGLMALFNATMRSGAELVLEYTKFDAKILEADVIITGEGTLDQQTASGKTIAAVCAHAQRLRVPVIAFAGMVDESDEVLRTSIGLQRMWCSTPDHATESDAMRNAAQYLTECVKNKLSTNEAIAIS